MENKNVNKLNIKKQYELIEFVDKIQSRDGWCSLEEIFVELITIHTGCFNEYSYSHKNTSDQIKLMWKDLKEAYPILKINIEKYSGDEDKLFKNKNKRTTSL